MDAGIFARLGHEILMDQAIAAEALPKPLNVKANAWFGLELVDGEKFTAFVAKVDEANHIIHAIALGSDGSIKMVGFNDVKVIKAMPLGVTWEIDPKGVTLMADPETQEDLKAKIAENGGNVSTNMEYDVLEGLFANTGMDTIRPEEVGALTDSIIFGEVDRDDQGNIVDTGNVYWDPNYAVRSFVQDLADKGEAYLPGAPENLGGGAARENTSEMQPSSLTVKFAFTAAPPKAPAEPASRGKAPQEEDMTEEAKKATEVKKTPPATLERMKQGPKSITKDVATATPEATEAQGKAVEAVLAYESQVQSLQKSIAGAISVLQKSLGEKKTGLASALETLYSLVEREANKAIRYKTDIIAVDAKREVKEAILTPGAEKKALEIIEKLDKRKAEIKDLNAELEALTMEQFRKHGGTETELQRVTTFPNPTLKSSMINALTMLGSKNTVEVRAGILDMLKGLVSKFKSIFSDGLDQDIAEFTQQAVTAGIKASENPEAESLMADFSEAEQEIADMRQGEAIDRKFDEAHKAELMEAMKASVGNKKFGREVYEAIEDENYHFLNEILTELGAYKP